MLHISARIDNSPGQHAVHLSTNDREHSLTVAPKPEGGGSSVNGGEMLFLALATCYCSQLLPAKAGSLSLALRR